MQKAARAALFDLDGTLLDTIDDITASMNHALDSLGFPPLSAKQFMSFVGSGIQVLAEKTLGAQSQDLKLAEELLDRFRTHYHSHLNVHTTIYDGITEVLNNFTRRKIPMGIISNKHYELTTKCVELSLNRWSFSAVIGAKGKFPKKPDPTSLLHVSELMNVPPTECIYVGDTDIDILAARNAGMQAVGVLWGFRQKEELQNAGADIILTKPEELIELIP